MTTGGELVTCLFAHSGTDLRGPLRQGASDEELAEIIRRIWLSRDDRYSEERTALGQDESKDTADRRGRVEMYQIGG